MTVFLRYKHLWHGPLGSSVSVESITKNVSKNDPKGIIRFQFKNRSSFLDLAMGHCTIRYLLKFI